MILGLGVDMVSVARIGRLKERHGPRFLGRVFTDEELADIGVHSVSSERVAARFAAKEAVMKALGTGWAAGVGFKQIEVSNLPSGRPVARLSGTAADIARELGAAKVLITMANEREWAVAVAVLEGGDADR
jgi:holo-[acyl-carrier protein] synthase